MTEVVVTTEDQTRRDGRVPVLVSATALGAHLGRQYIARLAAEGVIARSGAGYDQDQCRLRYIEHLRSARTARSEAEVAHIAAKAEFLRIKIAEKHKVLMEFAEHERFVEELVGLFLSRLSGFAARCGGRDLAVRREIDKAMYDLRVEISRAATKLADERGEPP